MYREIYDTLDKNGKVKTAHILTGPDAGRKYLVKDGSAEDMGNNLLCSVPGKEIREKYKDEVLKCQETCVLHEKDADIFVEIFEKNPHLVILGGGHVSVPVCKIGKMLGFYVTVMDDREEFLTKERFPDADRLVKGTFEEITEKIPPYENAYYVIVTRGHMGDSICARQILRRPYAYLGMIGSKNKIKITRHKLLGEGFTEKQLDSLHAPIGLPIGGQMPAEIAVSIMAEIVQEKNRNHVSYTDEKVEKAIKDGKNGTMMTIISKSGSSPRGVGSKMFLDRDGISYGSIGGGNVEYQASLYAPKAADTEVVKYNLSSQGEGNLGMICGGTVEVLFERII
ncbi:MAG: XdhC family protein [Blautia sp.]|nr:XdhC family protein [Blautia sp.]